MYLILLNITALLAIIPAVIIPFRRSAKKDMVFWSTIIIALCGTLVLVFQRLSIGWNTGLSSALWLTILSCMVIYAGMAKFANDSWRLSVILFPYLLVLAVLATIWNQVPDKSFVGDVHLVWIGTHILMSVGTYALITLAAVAALGASIQERALKSKIRTRLSRMLPSVAVSEGMLVRVLIASEIILGISLMTGMAVLYETTGNLLQFDHKTILTLTVFVIVSIMLVVHFRSGIRGRIANRIVLLAYLLLTLGYPGVKFITDVLLTS
jgi:ABC-type uncharacterized transport system permease subunit